MPYELAQLGVPFQIYDPTQFGMVTQDLNLFTSGNIARNNPLLVNNFPEAANKGWKYALAHPDEITQLIKDKYDLQNKSIAARE